ncbi:MAG: NAD-dependent epimerase/dehydratase family protein [Propionibacteriales bacterium]|nr:NAD-dependent epimerase/dehydratase family protein [Propionibacteriales bacterium]
MHYAITGATGFVGGAVARQLREAGHDVTALARDPGRATALTDLGCAVVPGDLADAAALDRLCAGTDGLFHIAGWYKVGSRNPKQGWEINVNGTTSALDAAKRANLPRVVYTSTLAVNSDTGGAVVDESYEFRGSHLTVYDETKARAHQIAQQHAAAGLPVVTVMPGVVYGPGDTSQVGRLLDQVVTGHRPLLSAGGGVCWGQVDDIARGHLLAMDAGVAGESYVLAGERASLADGLRLAAELAGTRGPLVLPTAAVRLTGRAAALVGRLVPLPPDFAAESVRSSLAHYWATPAKAERELGWTSRPLREGLSDLVASA